MINFPYFVSGHRHGPGLSRNRSAILLATAALLVPSPVWALDTLDLNNVATTRTTLDHTPGHPYDRVVNGPLTLTIIAPRILTYAGGLQDGAHPLSLGVNGGGTLLLTGSGLNTYSGDTRISSDSFLVAGAANALSANSVITSGIVDLGGFDQTIRGLVGSGPVRNSSASLARLTFLSPTGSTLTYSGSIAGNIGVVKSGGGRQVLGATNSYTGGTTITAGALAYGTDTSLGTGAIVLNGGTLAGSGAGLTLGNVISLGADSIYDRGGFSGLTLAGTISGNHALTVIGNGSVVLSGANTYTGGTILDAGRVIVGANAAFGTGTVTATNSARIEANADGYVVTNAFNLATLMQVVLPGAGNTLTLNGTLGGTGGLWVRSGDGVLRLGGNNAYTGVTQLGIGTLAVTSSTALGTGTLSVVGPATLRADAAGLTLANKVTLETGQLLTIDTAGVDLTLGGPVRNRVVANAGGFVKTGAGTLTLTNINSYSGGTRIADGAVSVADDRALGLTAGDLVFAGTGLHGGALIVTGTGFGSTARAIRLEGTGGAFDIADPANSFVVGQVITGSGELGKRGAGLLALDAANLYSGGTYLTAGTLRVGNSQALGSGALTIAGGTLLAGTAGLTLGNAVVLAPGATDTVDTGGVGLALGGTIGGTGVLTKTGLGTLALTGSGNSYSGGTALTVGAIAVGANGALGTGSAAMANGTSIIATASATLTNAFALTGTATFDTGGNALTLANPVTGSGLLVKTGGGTLTLAAANTHSGGTRVDAGTVAVANNAALGSGTAAFGAGTTLQAAAAGLTLGNALTVAGSAIDTQGFGLTLNGVVAGSSFTKNGGGALTLNAANSYTGGTIVAAGTVVAGNAAAFGSGAVALGSGTTLQSGAAGLTIGNAIGVAGSIVDTNGFDLTLGGIVSGAALTKAGAGTLTLAAANTYTGATTVAAGTLRLDGSTGAGPIAVAAGATLSGSGTAGGTATFANGATLSPGGGIGTLTLGGLVLSDTSSVRFDLGTPNVVGGPTNDLVRVTGNVTLDGQLSVNGGAGFGPGVYALIRYGGALTDQGLAIASLPGAYAGQVQTTIAGQVNLIVATPGALVQYWDGGDATGNGVIDGGPGVWSSGGTNWTGAAPSAINSNWQSAIGVFVAPGGAVTIVSPQTFQGLQFVGDGYVLSATGTGGLVTSSAAFISVDPGLTTTIAAPITGTGSLDKQGDGRLILSGASSYSGGTTVTAGTLGIGSNTAAGSGAVTLGAGTILQAEADGLNFGNAVFLPGSSAIDTQAFALLLGGVVSGPGSLTKTGSGNLTLGGTNTYAGGTTVAAGTLTGSATSFGSGGIVDNAALVLAQPTDATLGNAISGTGTVTKTGAGNLTLAGINTYAGGTTISGGTLTGSATSFGSGGIVDNAALVIVQPTDASFANAISGTGTLTKTGAGNLTLIAVNTYSGGTTISGGTMTGSVTGFGTGAIVDNAALVLAQPTDASFGNAISGTGTLTKTGVGNLALTGVNTYAGGTTIVAGTLTGSATSFGTGGIVDNAALVLAQPTDATLANAISGTGTVTKTGAGNLTLAGVNTYAGGTSIVAGTLTGSATSFGSGGIVDNAALVLAQPTDATLASAISGTGTVTKTGAGNLTLAGVNTYAGGTTISGGTLTGSATSFGSGNIVDNAALVLAQATDASFGNIISGTGTVTKTGAGNVTLAAVNTYAGGTTISGGTLTGSVTSFGSGNIVDNAALVIAQPTDASFATIISGSGTLTKTGAGNLTLTGASILSGATTVAAGRLTVTGSLSPSTVTVASGASLAGTGTIGGLAAQSGSLVTPGTASGMTATLTVAGNASFAPGSTFAVDVSPTTADLLRVGGSATLAGNLTIAPTGGQYLFNSVYTLVSAGSLTGTFTPPVLTNLFGPAFAPVLGYSGTTLTLKLVPNSIIGLATGLTLTPNERNRAAAFDQAVIAGYNPQGFFALFNQGAALPAALDQLTGEVHSATSRVAMEDTRHVREAVLDRLGAALSGLGKRDNATTLTAGDRSYTLWGRGVASWARTDASAIASGFDHDLTGTIVGFDIGAGDFKAGALFHYTRSTLDYAILGHGKVASTGVGIYGGYRADHGFAVGVGGSIAAVDIDTSRAITTVGYAQSLSSKSDGESRQVFADVSYDLATGSGARVEPFVRFAYVGFRADKFGESGGIAALYAPTQNYHTTFATLGARGAIAVGPVALKGSAGWLRTGGDRSPASLLALRDTASFASIEGVPLDRNALAAEAGAEIAIGRASTFGVGYSGVIGKATRDHGARATLTIGF